jgi:hypothetical protein
MVKITYNDGGGLITFFDFIGFGYTKVKTDDESSVTVTFRFWKLHTFLSFALL